MKSEKKIRDRLVALNGEYIPREYGGQYPVGKAKSLKWVLDDPEIEIDASGRTLGVTGVYK